MRLVSLCPSLTDTVFALGRGEALVGRTRYCVEPADEVERVETVGGTKDPDVERVLALAPDLVLLNEEENRVEDHDALTAGGLRCHVSFPRGPADVPALLRDLGHELGAADRADVVAEEVADALRQVRERGGAPVRFAYLVWRKPWMAVGGDTFVSALLEAAGGQNVFGARNERYPTLESEDLAAAHPDVVLLSSEPFPFGERHAVDLATATGLPSGRFRLVDGQRLSWHGARTRVGLPYAWECLRGRD